MANIYCPEHGVTPEVDCCKEEEAVINLWEIIETIFHSNIEEDEEL